MNGNSKKIQLKFNWILWAWKLAKLSRSVQNQNKKIIILTSCHLYFPESTIVILKTLFIYFFCFLLNHNICELFFLLIFVFFFFDFYFIFFWCPKFVANILKYTIVFNIFLILFFTLLIGFFLRSVFFYIIHFEGSSFLKIINIIILLTA